MTVSEVSLRGTRKGFARSERPSFLPSKSLLQAPSPEHPPRTVFLLVKPITGHGVHPSFHGHHDEASMEKAREQKCCGILPLGRPQVCLRENLDGKCHRRPPIADNIAGACRRTLPTKKHRLLWEDPVDRRFVDIAMILAFLYLVCWPSLDHIQQFQRRIAKPLFELLSLPVAGILSPVRRQGAIKGEKLGLSILGHK